MWLLDFITLMYNLLWCSVSSCPGVPLFARFWCMFVTWCEGLAMLDCIIARVKSKRLLSLKERFSSSVHEMRNAFLSRTILGLWFQGRRTNFWIKGYRFLSFFLLLRAPFSGSTSDWRLAQGIAIRLSLTWGEKWFRGERRCLRVCVGLTIVFFLFASRRAWTCLFPSLFLLVDKYCEAGAHAQFLVRRSLNMRKDGEGEEKKERNQQEGWTFCHGEDGHWHQRERDRKKIGDEKTVLEFLINLFFPWSVLS